MLCAEDLCRRTRERESATEDLKRWWSQFEETALRVEAAGGRAFTRDVPMYLEERITTGLKQRGFRLLGEDETASPTPAQGCVVLTITWWPKDE